MPRTSPQPALNQDPEAGSVARKVCGVKTVGSLHREGQERQHRWCFYFAKITQVKRTNQFGVINNNSRDLSSPSGRRLKCHCPPLKLLKRTAHTSLSTWEETKNICFLSTAHTSCGGHEWKKTRTVNSTKRKVNVRNQWPRNYLVNALTPQCLYHHFHDLFKSFTRNVRNQKMWKWPLLWPHDSLFHSESATTERKQVKIKLELDFQTFCFKLKLILKTKVRTCGMTKPFNLE